MKASSTENPGATNALRTTRTSRIVDGFVCYSLAPPAAATGKTVIYLHGGCYISEIAPQHWKFVARLVDAGCRVEVPVYGLAPQHTHREAFSFVTAVYRELLLHVDPSTVVWMGDSAGGGLALAVAQTLPEVGLAVPARLILLSPWLDVTMTNPGIAEIAARDPWLSAPGLVECGVVWSGGDDTRDPRSSPINGPMAGLPPIDVFIGTADILAPDVRLLKTRAAEAGVAVHVTEAAGAFHVYVLAPVAEARPAIAAILATVRSR